MVWFMAKFVFQLEAVLRHRKQLEKERQRALAQILEKMTELQMQLRELDETVQRANSQMRAEHLTGNINIGYLTAHRRFMFATQRKALTLMQRMTLVQRQVDEARQQLADAARYRKVIEKLKERHHERWKMELSRRELSEMDEIGMHLSYWQGDTTDRESSADPVWPQAAASGARPSDLPASSVYESTSSHPR